jgi:hypothetical protein
MNSAVCHNHAPSGQLSFQSLLGLTDEELARQDVAEVNLACAVGLPGSEQMDVPGCLRTLNRWAMQVRRETDRLYYQFQRSPDAFENSRAYFRMMVLVTVLQRDLGVSYNPDRIDDEGEWPDARDRFVHGVIQGKGGTCTSLPVVYVAVGRRLGYPLKLVTTTQHLFARWDDPGGERLNLECTSVGLVCPPDEYYVTGRYALTPEQVRRFCFLKCLTPREELAAFLVKRGFCWLDNGHHHNAVEAFAMAASLVPQNESYLCCIAATMRRWVEKLQQSCPPNFPAMTIRFPRQRRFPVLPRAMEQEIIHLQVMEEYLTDQVRNRDWWEPMRCSPKKRPAHVPSEITVCVNQ